MQDIPPPLLWILVRDRYHVRGKALCEDQCELQEPEAAEILQPTEEESQVATQAAAEGQASEPNTASVSEVAASSQPPAAEAAGSSLGGKVKAYTWKFSNGCIFL